jgi:hypothetical protein
MSGSVRPSLSLLAALFTLNLGCGQIEMPVTFALQGDNTITIEAPSPPFPPNRRTFTTTLVGGAEATIIIDLNPFELFTPNGLAALITVDRVHIAGTDINILGLHTGTVCVYDDVENPGGGIAYIRPLRQEADFNLALNTVISTVDLFTEGLPFAAVIDTTVPVTLSQLIGLLAGSNDGGLALSQEIETTLPADVPFLGGGTVTANLTLGTVDALPTDPLLDECEDFLAGL